MTTKENTVMERHDSLSMMFLGVSTSSSRVQKLFHDWSRCLKSQLLLVSRDLPLGSERAEYRHFVDEMRSKNPPINGALITSHKAALYDAAYDLFDQVDTTAQRLEEVGMIYWKNNMMIAGANDALSTRRVTQRMLLKAQNWMNGCRRAIILGGGGAGVALANTLVTDDRLGCVEVIVTEIDQARIEKLSTMFEAWNSPIPLRVLPSSSGIDELISASGPGSLIANATGLGKDREGNPVSANVKFPKQSFIWEFNYRFCVQAEPTFMEIALSQSREYELTIEDGTDYFIWGWLCVMANILSLQPTEYYNCFSRVAKRVTK